MLIIKFISKFVAVAIITVLLVACVTTKGGYSEQSDTAQVATGAAIGGAIGLLGCKFLKGRDCGKYAIAGQLLVVD